MKRILICLAAVATLAGCGSSLPNMTGGQAVAYVTSHAQSPDLHDWTNALNAIFYTCKGQSESESGLSDHDYKLVRDVAEHAPCWPKS